ncbi:butyrophilin subfamily 1 member A1-like [Emydura macquarii macquarii]|uniref:butyrophilin subfamily 1 member A1-like n=1 Tax=Emydura macquarii macquarii TaxID=1129001 RepID=UPI00352A0436
MLGVRCLCSNAATLSAILLLHVQAAAAVSFQVLAPAGPLSAPLGGTVVLPCHLSPALSAQAMQVKWSRPQLGQDVHVYRPDGSEVQGARYRGRTELLRDGMQSGSVALRLWNLTLWDEGRYLCDFQSDAYFSDAALELHVTSSGSDPHLHVGMYKGTGIRVMCLSAGWYPEPNVLWRNSREEILNTESKEKLRSADGLFNVSSSVVVAENSDPALTCIIRPGSPGPEKVSAILISDAFFPRVSYWWVALSVILTIICVCFLTLAAFSLWRIGKEKGTMYTVLKKSHGRPSWKEAFLKAADVTLDPRTAHPGLELFAHRKGLRNTSTRQSLPDGPERFDVYSCVLGSDGYVSGTHYWDVEVAGAEGWALGVTRESASRKGRFNFCPEQGTWAIQFSMGQYRTVTAEWNPLHPPQSPGTIRVYLDYEGGVVCFYDANTIAPIHAFTTSFTGKIYPFFWVWSVGTSLRLCA